MIQNIVEYKSHALKKLQLDVLAKNVLMTSKNVKISMYVQSQVQSYVMMVDVPKTLLNANKAKKCFVQKTDLLCVLQENAKKLLYSV